MADMPDPDLTLNIYVDGCFLQASARNPHAANGWGIVIVSSDNPDAPRMVAAGDGIHPRSSQAENMAILQGLHEAYQHEFATAKRAERAVQVTLYSDQRDRVEQIKRHLNDTSIPIGTGLLKDTVSLMQAMQATPVKAVGSRPWMKHAHALASHGAWKARLASQEFIALGEQHYEGAEAEAVLARKQIFDFDTKISTRKR